MKQGKIYITGVIGEDVNLIDVVQQVKAQKNVDEFLVKIDSVGGYVNVGYDIYNYLKNLPQNVITETEKAYSIASVIFMAGDVRQIPEGVNDAIMIHLPWVNVSGDYNYISEHLNELKKVEDELISFYQNTLEIDDKTIKSLLTQETYLNTNQCIDLGFATEIKKELKAVAMLNINNNQENKESLMTNVNKKIDQILNFLTGVKNEKLVQDATGVELVFADLAAQDEVQVGDKATVDGKPADGEYLLPDGSKMIMVKGNVDSIEPAPETPEAPVEPTLNAVSGDTTSTDTIDTPEEEVTEEDKDAMIADLQEQVQELRAKLAEYEVEEVIEETVDAVEMDKVLDMVLMMATKQKEIEEKYFALAKSVGSNFENTNNNEIKTSVKADADKLSRAARILNS